MMVIGCVSALPCAFAHAHYFARFLTVMVKIIIIGINVAVVLSGSLVWWNSVQDYVVQWDLPDG